MNKSFKIAATAFLLSLSTLLRGQVVNSLVRETDPAAMGLAGAGVAMQANAYALYNNPAAISLASGRFAAGAQYALKDMVFFRAGYHLGSSETAIPPYLSLGLGFHFRGIRLDVSFLTASETLGNTLAFGLGYVF